MTGSASSIVVERLGGKVTCSDLVSTLHVTKQSLQDNQCELSRTVGLEWGADIILIENEKITYDLILGSDLIYDPSLHDALIDTLVQLGKLGNTKCLLSFEQRRRCIDPFFDKLTERGFHSRPIETPMLRKAKELTNVRIYETVYHATLPSFLV